MLKVIRKSHVGKEDYDFVTIYHHFSSGHYFDKGRMGIGPLRVFNVERIIPNKGYETHNHRDMEIISYVFKGTLTHEDDLGHKAKITKGGAHYIGAGTGLNHSEMNLEDESLRMVSLWIEPEKRNLEPIYQAVNIDESMHQNKLIKLASNYEDGLIKIRQNVHIYVMDLDEEHYKSFELRGATEMYLYVISGDAYINGKHIYAGDAIHATETLHIQPISHAHFIITEIF